MTHFSITARVAAACPFGAFATGALYGAPQILHAQVSAPDLAQGLAHVEYKMFKISADIWSSFVVEDQKLCTVWVDITQDPVAEIAGITSSINSLQLPYCRSF